MSKFKYLTPKTIEEAISMYFERPDQYSMYMAGGTDALLKIKKNKIHPDRIISLKHIKTHNTINMDPYTHNIIIGGFTTHKDLEDSTLIHQKYEIIHDAVKNIGSVQIRNIATIGGNLVNAVPSADGAIPLMALDSQVRLQGRNGKRTINLVDFFTGPGTTVLKSGEILTDIIVPKTHLRTAGAYKKFGRRAAMELPVVGVGIVMSLMDNTDVCKNARICLGVAAPTPMRAFHAEKLLENKLITEDLLTRAGTLAAEESKVRDTARGKAWHRKTLISTFVKRMGLLAIERIKHHHA